MSVFAYTALSRDGRQTTGTLNAESRSAAIASVMEKGLHPVSVEESRGGRRPAADSEPGRKPGGRVSQKSVEAFTRELSNLLAGGVPLSRALHLLRREASNPAA